MTNDVLPRREVHILDAQANALEERKPGAIKQRAIKSGVPRSSDKTLETSSRVITTGRRTGRFA